MPVVQSPQGAVLEDLNADGIPDLVTVSFIANEVQGVLPGVVSALLGLGDGTFVLVQEITVGTGALSLAAGHLNGDRFLDVLTANSHSHDVSVLLGQGDGRFVAGQTIPVDLGAGSGPSAVAVADLSGDGVPIS
jgi:hypothetical protein